MIRKILLLDSGYTNDTAGKEYLKEINRIINDPSIGLKAWSLKDSDLDLSKTIHLAINKCIQEQFNAILLNMRGIDIVYVLQLFMDARIPLILITNETYENDNRYIATVQKFSKRRGLLCCITSDQLKYLSQYIYGLSPHNTNSETNYGFLYRNEEAILIREYILEKFNQVAKEILESKRIEIPLIAPISNFLATEPGVPRPLQSKDSNKLFAAVANDGNALSVRYEGTALVTKLVAEYLINNKGNRYNYHYFQEMVRMEFQKDLDKNHYRAFYQAGVELFTINKEEHLNNICNIAKFLLNFTQLLNPQLYFIARFSHINVLKPLNLYLNKEEDRFARNKLIHIMEKGSEYELSEMLKSLRTDEKRDVFLLKLKHLQLQKQSISDGVKILLTLPEYKEFNIDISELIQIKDNEHLRNCIFDPGIHRSLNFYSGITMQGDLEYNGTIQKEFLGGGSFSGMVESFGYCGAPVFSFGVAIGVERLMNLLK